MQETTAALLMGRAKDAHSLGNFLRNLHDAAGRLVIFLSKDSYEELSSLALSVTCRTVSDDILSRRGREISSALSEALRAAPDALHLVTIDCSGNFPSLSKAAGAFRAGFDYVKLSNCTFFSRRYAEQVVRNNDEPSYENARTQRFKVPSLLSQIAHSPFQAIRENTIIRFAIVGASGTVINYAVVGLFKIWFPWLSLVLADAIGIELSIINNFIWNDKYTFRASSHESAKLAGGAGFRFVKYNAVSLVSTFVNLAVFYYLNYAFSIYWVWSLTLAIAAAFLVNYFGSSRWAWREPIEKMQTVSALKN